MLGNLTCQILKFGLENVVNPQWQRTLIELHRSTTSSSVSSFVKSWKAKRPESLGMFSRSGTALSIDVLIASIPRGSFDIPCRQYCIMSILARFWGSVTVSSLEIVEIGLLETLTMGLCGGSLLLAANFSDSAPRCFCRSFAVKSPGTPSVAGIDRVLSGGIVARFCSFVVVVIDLKSCWMRGGCKVVELRDLKEIKTEIFEYRIG